MSEQAPISETNSTIELRGKEFKVIRRQRNSFERPFRATIYSIDGYKLFSVSLTNPLPDEDAKELIKLWHKAKNLGEDVGRREVQRDIKLSLGISS